MANDWRQQLTRFPLCGTGCNSLFLERIYKRRKKEKNEKRYEYTIFIFYEKKIYETISNYNYSTIRNYNYSTSSSSEIFLRYNKNKMMTNVEENIASPARIKFFHKIFLRSRARTRISTLDSRERKSKYTVRYS